MILLNSFGFVEIQNTIFKDGQVLSEEDNFYIKAYYGDSQKMLECIATLKEFEIKYQVDNKILKVGQTHLINGIVIKKEFVTERRAWIRSGGAIIDCKTMTHQELSNCVGLLELLLQKQKIGQVEAEEYLVRIEENISPELQERFEGELLPYQAYYEWEKKLIAS